MFKNRLPVTLDGRLYCTHLVIMKTKEAETIAFTYSTDKQKLI